MIRWIILLMLILIMGLGSATVEDLGNSAETGAIVQTPQTLPTTPSLSSLPIPTPNICTSTGYLIVDVGLTGPQSETDKDYTTQGKSLDFVVTVKNVGSSEADVDLSVDPEDCALEWFSWTTTSLKIPPGASRSENLEVKPDINAVAGDYSFKVIASANCYRSGSAEPSFKVQDYDYASETAISGTGQFQLNKDISSMDSGIKSTKDISFSGSIDALVKNEYLVNQAKGRNPNFEEQDAVDNYMAVNPGDALLGTENFKSSSIFGGVGAKLTEAYNVKQMEFQNQNFDLHQTGSLKKMAELKTADNFTGYYLIDAKQTNPGLKNLKEHEEFLGSFEINRRILFRDNPTVTTGCADGPCTGSTSVAKPNFPSPCLSSSCNNFANSLNAFANSA
ncbi:MAG: hypothetical protein WB392_13495 [Methanotrichaceae archaeon]